MQTGFIGAGVMAEAIVAGMLRDQAFQPADIAVSDIDAGRRRHMADTYGVVALDDNAALAREAATTVLAVKPQQFDDALAAVASAPGRDRRVVSIAAGRRLAGIEARLPGARVIRAMPNLAARVGAGMHVIRGGSLATSADLRVVRDILACSGKVMELPEDQFDVVTALSGSGPAFVACFVEALIRGAAGLGMDPAAAATLAAQTLLGAARVFDEGLYTPAALIAAVASKGGTTEAGLAVLRQAPFDDIIFRTLEAAAARSRALARPDD